jgi:hypothetical protein
MTFVHINEPFEILFQKIYITKPKRIDQVYMYLFSKKKKKSICTYVGEDTEVMVRSAKNAISETLFELLE